MVVGSRQQKLVSLVCSIPSERRHQKQFRQVGSKGALDGFVGYVGVYVVLRSVCSSSFCYNVT